jgi:hypothetical protein
MICDPKAATYIQWTEMGTRCVSNQWRGRALADQVYSFVVSNTGEFSRNILGSHFKHSNVRILSIVHPSRPR